MFYNTYIFNVIITFRRSLSGEFSVGIVELICFIVDIITQLLLVLAFYHFSSWLL